MIGDNPFPGEGNLPANHQAGPGPTGPDNRQPAPPAAELPELVEQRERICKLAINHVLCRIHDDARVRHLLGYGTEAYDLLTVAAAALFHEPVRDVREKIIPGSGDLV